MHVLAINSLAISLANANDISLLRTHWPIQGGSGQTFDEYFCSAKIDFRTKWPTPRVVIIQKAFRFRGASPPGPQTRGSALRPRWGLCPRPPL